MHQMSLSSREINLILKVRENQEIARQVYQIVERQSQVSSNNTVPQVLKLKKFVDNVSGFLHGNALSERIILLRRNNNGIYCGDSTPF